MAAADFMEAGADSTAAVVAMEAGAVDTTNRPSLPVQQIWRRIDGNRRGQRGHENMMPPTLKEFFTRLLTAGGLLLLLGSGCTHDSASPDRSPAATRSAAPATMAGEPAPDQPVFDSDTAAVNALLAAVKANDQTQVHHLLGAASTELLSGDPVEDANDFKDFAARAAQRMQIQKKNDSTSVLRVGQDDWMFPIPIVRDSQGKWFLDTEAGKQEVFARRIGQNELEAIHICRLYVQAQREYAKQSTDASGAARYAQRIISTPGRRDGLYWHAAPDQPKSPLARLVATEKVQGYTPTSGKHMPYQGYRFRVLKKQGAHAPGGAINYIKNGAMTRGFALVAYPASYESSGVMTFIVNQDGNVYQKDLGPGTEGRARHMTEYDPDASWALVTDRGICHPAISLAQRER
jgi:hypothetical protein